MAILTVNNIKKMFGTDVIIQDITFEVQKGDRIGLVGINGSGKTTLFKVLNGEYTADEGTFTPARETSIGYMEQHVCRDMEKPAFDEVMTVFAPLLKEKGYEVSTKVFNDYVQPDKAFFGQKDAQQLAIIKRMVADLNMNVKVYGCPIVREEDGLAKSSRNSYLSAEERKAALCLSRSIFAAQDLIEGGERNADIVRTAVREIIEAEPLAQIDYIEAVDLGNMQPVDSLGESGLVAIAVYIGKTRLIDNYLFDFDE